MSRSVVRVRSSALWFFLDFCRRKLEAKKRVGEILALLAPATTSTRRFPANQIPALRFSALLNEEAPEVELMLA